MKNEQNEHISVKLQFSVLLSNFQKTAFYRSSLNEQNEQICENKENEQISRNDQNEQISVIPMDFQKRAFYHLVYLYYKITRFQ